MIDRDDVWFVRLQEGVKADPDGNRRETAAVVARLGRWLIGVLRGLALVSHAIMGPPEPELSPAQLLAERRARRRERRAARRQARRDLRERRPDASDAAN